MLAFERTSPGQVWGFAHQPMCSSPCREIWKRQEKRGVAESPRICLSDFSSTMLAFERTLRGRVWGFAHQPMCSRPSRELLKRLEKQGGAAHVRARESV